jgi:DHA2 family methylenomycin A resistance protein-like MFS transporter
MARAEHSVSAFTIVGIALASALVPLNSTMIAVALPTLSKEFDIAKGDAAVLVTIYLAAMLFGQPLSGRLADVIGARRLGIIAVSGFGLCSAAAMLAPTFSVLVAIRAGQAIFASGLSPSVQSLLRAITTPSERGRAFGVQGSVIGAGAGLGPVIGGLLLAGFGWRAIFAVNIPIVIVVLIVLQRSVPVDTHAIDEVVDEPAQVVGGSEGATPRLFNRVFSAAFSTQALSVFAQYTLLLVTPIVLDDRGWGTGSIGIALSTLTLGMIVMGPPGGRLGDEWGRRRPVLIGLAVATVSVGAAVVFGDDVASAMLIGSLLFFGLGLGVATPSVLTAGVEAAPAARVGLASGVLASGRYVGSIVASILLSALVADNGDGVTTMLAMSTVALILSLGAAANLPSRPAATESDQPQPVGERSVID